MSDPEVRRLLELLVNGIRIQMQITVDLHYGRLSQDVKREIQRWYDELESICTEIEEAEK